MATLASTRDRTSWTITTRSSEFDRRAFDRCRRAIALVESVRQCRAAKSAAIAWHMDYRRVRRHRVVSYRMPLACIRSSKGVGSLYRATCDSDSSHGSRRRFRLDDRSSTSSPRAFGQCQMRMVAAQFVRRPSMGQISITICATRIARQPHQPRRVPVNFVNVQVATVATATTPMSVQRTIIARSPPAT